MSVPIFATGQPLSAGAVNRLDEALDTLAERAMSIAVPQLVVTANYQRAKRGYVIHRHDADIHAGEVLVYDLLVAGVGSGKKVRISYAGSPLYTFDGSDAAHGNGRKCGTWSLHDFPTAGTHPANDDDVQVDVEVVDGDETVSCAIYGLREGIVPDITTVMLDVEGTALVDDEDDQVPIDLQRVSTEAAFLQAFAHSRVPGFWPKERQGGDVNDNVVFTVGTWRWNTNKGHKLYYSLRVFKENQGSHGAKHTTVKVYVQPDTAGSGTLVGTFYAGSKLDPEGDRRGDRFYEGHIDITAVDRYQNQPCIVYVTVENNGTGGNGEPEYDIICDSNGRNCHQVPNPNYISGDGYGGCTVYMLREEADQVPGAAAFAGAEYGVTVEGYPSTPPLRELWNNAVRLAGDTQQLTGGYGTNGLNVAAGYPHGYALLYFSNPVMFGGPQQNEDMGAVMTEARGIRSGDELYYIAQGDTEFVYTDSEGSEATRQLEEKTDDYPFRILDLTDIDDLPKGAGWAVRSVPTTEHSTEGGNWIYGVWQGDAE